MTLNTWEGISACAKQAGAKFPELVAAQWALESGWGQHTSGTNNFFGLKGGNGTAVGTWEYYNTGWTQIKARFMDFPTIEACVKYLVDRWYKNWNGYKGVNNAENREKAAKMLISEGYATDPDYADKLIKLMNQKASITMPRQIKLVSAAKYYEAESHQIAAWNWLEDQLTENQLNEFALLYRSGPSKPKNSNPLQIPYFSQRDNISGTGYRECFSSSCAMVAAYYGKVRGDDEYNVVRARYGDTTDPNAQVETLRALELKARFTTIATEQMVKQEIDAGRPVPCGWLHHGHVTSPSGGGHWSVVIGYTDTHYIMNDPFGKADVANGGYVSASGGNGVKYSRDNWVPRWCVKGSGGWCIFVNN